MTTYEKMSLAFQCGIAVIGLGASVIFGSMISEIRAISDNTVLVVQGVQKIADIDPAKVKEVGNVVSGATSEVGDAATGVVTKLKDALNK